MARSPEVTCSPEATTKSNSRASHDRGCRPRPADQLIGGSRHGRNDDGHLVPSLDLALHMARDIADPVDVRYRRSAEFHDETAHLTPLPYAEILGRTLAIPLMSL